MAMTEATPMMMPRRRQDRPQDVPPQGAERRPDGAIERLHGTTLGPRTAGPERPKLRQRVRRRGNRRGRRRHVRRMRLVLDQAVAGCGSRARRGRRRSASWVTRMIVMPSSSLSCWNIRRTSSLGARVEVAGRLVGEQQRRAVDQRPGDRDALLLPAGELRRLVVACGRPARPGSEISAARARPSLLRQVLGGVGQRHHHVIQRGGSRQQVEALEDETRSSGSGAAPAGRRESGDFLAVEPVWPAVGRSRQPRMFISVVLPEPVAPISATISPRSISSETPLSTGTSISPT